MPMPTPTRVLDTDKSRFTTPIANSTRSKTPHRPLCTGSEAGITGSSWTPPNPRYGRCSAGIGNVDGSGGAQGLSPLAHAETVETARAPHRAERGEVRDKIAIGCRRQQRAGALHPGALFNRALAAPVAMGGACFACCRCRCDWEGEISGFGKQGRCPYEQ
ncbi:hypothetical protein [Oryza sativa Japonica Group]|uniref:Uncharacterized protein n=2 Tax=Oryza sativa subsp. japonica TaxID=39947 RepID=Q5NB39_ORYSJ|nr:hypothetical protein [Oryza sativa Japonica Group]BAD81462.1 hypothetical protein [Oryza sativa Japonica Group]